jgi:hypothetical protein
MSTIPQGLVPFTVMDASCPMAIAPGERTPVTCDGPGFVPDPTVIDAVADPMQPVCPPWPVAVTV